MALVPVTVRESGETVTCPLEPSTVIVIGVNISLSVMLTSPVPLRGTMTDCGAELVQATGGVGLGVGVGVGTGVGVGEGDGVGVGLGCGVGVGLGTAPPCTAFRTSMSAPFPGYGDLKSAGKVSVGG